MNCFALLSMLFLFSQAWALKYTDCGSKTGKIKEVYLSGCEDSDVCELKRGETYTYKLSFESMTESESLKAVVHGVVGGVSMPYPIPNSDACEEEGVDCPIESGKTYSYGNEIEVRQSYPSVRADVKWQLKDASNKDVVCVLIPVKIV
ncbi:NPC intracellular cholesterol transporter 2-like [Uloborus diversus]|uniref:NPC intracellular cholesterol transporter 2-like n=1 Tax=Uloborus diversus TaxID=327109 RepID=UPI002409439E|nr:NPC intracellular cholesterol transporter 2-like [Uloborus diversus]